jgi:hypothetical protein
MDVNGSVLDLAATRHHHCWQLVSNVSALIIFEYIFDPGFVFVYLTQELADPCGSNPSSDIPL